MALQKEKHHAVNLIVFILWVDSVYPMGRLGIYLSDVLYLTYKHI